MKILFFENKGRYREDHDKSRKCVHNEFIFLLSLLKLEISLEKD